MSIELLTAAPAAPRLDKGPAKSQRVGDEDARQAGADHPSFAAMLTSLDGIPAAGDTALAGGMSGGMAVAETPPAVAPPVDPALLLAQGQGLAPVPDGMGTMALPDAWSPKGAVAVALDAAARGVVGGPVGLEADHVPVAAGARQPGGMARPAGLGADPGTDTGAAAAGDTAGLQPVRRRPDPLRREALADATTSDPSSRPRNETAQLADVAKTDWRTALAAQAERVAGSGAVLAELGAGGFQSLPGTRASDRQPGRSVFMPLDTASSIAAAAQAAGGSAAAGTPMVATADAPALVGASSEVAQKVHYWVTRGVQNAELQLDGFDGGSVDVSISLQGNQATVEFRTDESEARRLLQDAMPQLRDMLRAEGLELSAGHVATSAQQDAQPGQQGDSGSGARKAPTAAGSDASPERPARPVTARAHGLDVFV